MIAEKATVTTKFAAQRDLRWHVESKGVGTALLQFEQRGDEFCLVAIDESGAFFHFM